MAVGTRKHFIDKTSMFTVVDMPDITKYVKLNPRWRRPSRQYFGFQSSRAATASHVSKKNITFCLNQG